MESLIMERLIYEFANLFKLLLMQVNLIYTSINLCLYYAPGTRRLQPCPRCPDFPPFNPFLYPLERLSQSCSACLEREEGSDPVVLGRNWRFWESLASQGAREVAAGSC